jgi:hypothetical protein
LAPLSAASEGETGERPALAVWERFTESCGTDQSDVRDRPLHFWRAAVPRPRSDSRSQHEFVHFVRQSVGSPGAPSKRGRVLRQALFFRLRIQLARTAPLPEVEESES